MPDLDSKLKKLDDAKDWYLKLSAADPQNKDGYHSLAVIDWVKWHAESAVPKTKTACPTRATIRLHDLLAGYRRWNRRHARSFGG